MSETESRGDWDECVDRLYEAVGQESALREAIGSFIPLFEAHSAMFQTAPADQSQRSMDVAAVNVAPQTLVEYHSHFHQHDEWVKAGWAKGAFNLDAVHRGADLVPRRELMKSYFWHGFLSRNGIADMISTVVDVPEGDRPAAIITFHRRVDQPPYQARMRGLMQRLSPHVRRVWRLHRRVAPDIAVGATLKEMFYAMDAPMLFIGFGGEIVESNAAGNRVMSDPGGPLRTRDGSLEWHDGRHWQSVLPMLQRLASDGIPTIDVQARDASGANTATVTLRRMHGAFTDTLVQHPAAAVCTIAPARTRPSKGAHERFGFTTAEAEVARLLVGGKSVSEVARDRGIAVSTVRTHVANLFSKTGTNRQAQLVGLLMSAANTG